MKVYRLFGYFFLFVSILIAGDTLYVLIVSSTFSTDGIFLIIFTGFVGLGLLKITKCRKD
jgi:hypothetical protein